VTSKRPDAKDSDQDNPTVVVVVALPLLTVFIGMIASDSSVALTILIGCFSLIFSSTRVHSRTVETKAVIV
jgi:ABC-type transport system involved in cytochrome c biogenesis permease component